MWTFQIAVSSRHAKATWSVHGQSKLQNKILSQNIKKEEIEQ